MYCEMAKHNNATTLPCTVACVFTGRRQHRELDRLKARWHTAAGTMIRRRDGRVKKTLVLCWWRVQGSHLPSSRLHRQCMHTRCKQLSRSSCVCAVLSDGTIYFSLSRRVLCSIVPPRNATTDLPRSRRLSKREEKEKRAGQFHTVAEFTLSAILPRCDRPVVGNAWSRLSRRLSRLQFVNAHALPLTPQSVN